MLAIAVIAFREFLEAFLLIGIFVGVNQKYQIHKLKEIISASVVGTGISFLLPCTVFLFAKPMSLIISEKNTDVIEGYLLLFSGIFLAYVIFSLHRMLRQTTKKIIAGTSAKMEQQIFDISMWMVLVFFITREGFEIALLVATTALFSTFWINMLGFIVGFAAAGSIGLLTVFGMIRISVKHIFQYTQYAIILIGSAMVKNGVSILIAYYFHLSLQSLFPFSLYFIPRQTTILGHLLYNFLGLQQHMSMLEWLIMAFYIGIIWYIFLGEKTHYEKKTA